MPVYPPMRLHLSGPAVLVLALTASPVLAQSVSIGGTVRDAQTREALIGANVMLLGTSLGSATDYEGRYRISNVRAGTYAVRVGYIGYTTLIDTLVIAGDGDVRMDFSLRFTALEGEEIVVTAQAQGQLAAINQQLAEKSLVNIVSSDRIEELPDANAAESLARIPGVTVQREGGEGNKVVIRGLSPQYNAVSVNGVRLSATGSSDRSTDVSMVSQYMLDGIEVTKAGTPDLDGDVLGGTVNFRLKKAEPGFHARVLAQKMHNDLRGSYDDFKLVLNASNRFFGDRWGVLALVDLERRNRSSNELSATYFNPNAVADSLNEVRTQSASLHDIIRLNNRTNTLFVTDYRLPNGNVRYSFLNSTIQSDQTDYFENYPLAFGQRVIDVAQGDKNTRVNTHILEYDQTLGSRLHISASASRSNAGETHDVFDARLLQDHAFTVGALGVPVEDLQSLLTDEPTEFADGYTMPYDDSDETNTTFALDVGYDLRLFEDLSGTIKTGVKRRTKRRTFDRNVDTGRVNYAWYDAMDSLLVAFPILDEYGDPGVRRFPAEPFVGDNTATRSIFDGAYSLGPFADLGFMREIAAFLEANFSQADYWEFRAHTVHATDSNLYDYSGDERYTAAYLMADLSIGPKLSVVAGARWEQNRTTYTSWQGWINVIPSFSFAGYEKVIHERQNDFILPAVFLRYRPSSWLELRLSRTHTLARPNYTDLLPLASFSGIDKSVIMRNPFLEPALSKNLDISASVNQNYIGFLSASYFEKDIVDLIYSSGKRYIADPAEFGLPETLEKGFIQDYISNNPNSARLRGLEVDFQTRFWYLPGFLSGLVFNGNYTVTTSRVRYPRTVIEYEIDYGPPISVNPVNHDTLYVDRMIDQPDRIMNLSMGYDYRGFSARLSMIYRSDIFRKSNFWRELRESTAAFRRWDLSLKQSLPVQGLDIYLNVSNITESEDVNQLLDPTRAVGLRQFYGRTVDLGIRYAF